MFVITQGKSLLKRSRPGQALVEYALILVLVAIMFGVALAATGPAIGNVFSNTVYNLLGQEPGDVQDLSLGAGSRDNFWATVAWVAANPPADVAVPPNPPRPPTSTPTAGPSPTPTNTQVPVPPTNTPTHTPPPTVTDHAHNAPWLDTIDQPIWWRTDKTIWLGSDDWRGEYFANRTLSGEPVYVLWNQQISPNYRGKIDFDWGNDAPIVGFQQDNFSIRFTRQIYVQGPDPVRVTFTTTADDGVRLWINYEPGCASVNSGGGSTGSFRVYQDGESDGGDPTKNCLIIDNWRDQSPTTYSVTRTIAPGFHVLQLDYYDSGWGARLRLDIEGANSSNPSDVALGGGTPVCNWGRPADTRANSKDFMWDEDKDGDFPANMRCHLELRGSVDFSALVSPKLAFWDVWDLSAGTRVWLEIAEYHPDPAQRNWQSIPLRSGGTTNYAWTRNVIDLVPYVSGYATRKLTFRFVMENNGGGSNRRWYVDDVQVADFNTNSRFFTVCSGSKATCGSYWNLNNPFQARDFITSGRWALTSAGGLTGGGGDMGWDDSPGDIYYRNYEGNDSSPRVHYVEFNGWVDLTGGMIPDADGDDGPPQISFYMRYDIGRRTTLALQWTRDQHDLTPDNWNTFEVLVPYNASNSQTDLTWRLREVLLTSVPNWNTQPFRMRFAMIVPQSAYERDGWYIDEIYLERVGRQKFTNYPFFDNAENGSGNWLGQWAVTDTVPGHLGSRFSFADSPNGNYVHNTEPYMELRYFIDLNNDTPANRNEFFENNPAGGNSQVAPANRPMLTFWFRRELSNSDNLFVEWTKSPNPGPSDWRVAWAYYYAAGTNIQRAWERIEIDLSFLQAGTLITDDKTDDDILIRFRLDARSGGPTSVADGVYVDSISIRDYTEESHRLWDPSVNTGFGAGQNTRYTDDVETDWWERWHTGGTWAAVSYDRRNGVNAFHDSPPQDTSTTVQTFAPLEMMRIIDLRSVTSGDRPTLYFWNRYNIGSSHAIRVQVSTENASYTRSATETNYERRTGWDDWTTVWSRGGSSRVDTWIREQIDLSGYIGRRIRVRWVMDAYARSNTRDGWYIDLISFEHRQPLPIRLPFFDPAQSLGNWIAEGIWGLAPDQWRGSGGGPADLGPHFWDGTFYDCERVRGSACGTTTHFNQVLYTDFATLTERPPSTDHRDLKMTALDIYLDLGSGRPPGASFNPTWGGIDNNTWFDTFAARFKRDVTIQNSGEYTFITISDDGVRLRWRYKDGVAPPPGYPSVPPGWNIIQYWQDTGRYVSIGSVEFTENANPSLPRYELILEWYEKYGDAVLIFSAGRSNFSFTDSPRAGSNPALFPVVNSIPFGNSSLILRQPLDLGGTFRPAVEYYTRYKINSDGSANVEVSTDGGFTWTRNNLSSTAFDGWTCPSGASCDTSWNGTFWSDTNPNLWQLRQHNLSAYKTVRFVNLRFRLQTGASSSDGWYVTDIQVNAATVGP